MLKLIILAIGIFLIHNELTQKPSGVSDSLLQSKSRIDEFKRIGKNATKSTKNFKLKADDYIKKFDSLCNAPNLYTKTLADFNRDYQGLSKHYSYRIYSDLNPEEEALFEKLKSHVDKNRSRVKELADKVYASATSARARCFKPIRRKIA